MSVSVFFDLPEVQQLYVCSSWLRVADLNRLDSAVCSRKLRTEFLDLVASPQFELSADMVHLGYRKEQVEWMIKRCIRLTAVTFYNDLLKKYKSWFEFFDSTGASLRRLSLSGHENPHRDSYANLKFFSLKEIFFHAKKFCAQLTEISVQFADADYCSSSEFRKLLTANTELRVVKLMNVGYVISECMESILDLPNLQSLNLDHTTLDASLKLIPNSVVNSSVTHLSCYHTEYEFGNARHFCVHFPNLTHIVIDVANSADLIVISKSCPLLSVVSIQVEEKLNKQTTTTLANNWKQLTRLSLYCVNVSAFHDRAWFCFVELCPSLVYLNVISSAADDSNDCAVHSKPPPGVYPADYTSSRLRELFADNMNAETLETIVSLCPYLYTLALHHHDSETYFSIYPVEAALHCICDSSIRVLSLHNYKHLDHTHLLPLHHITDLYLTQIGPDVTNNTITELARRCPALRVVCLRMCAGITDALILPLLDLCTTLQVLKLLNREKSCYDKCTTEEILRTLILRTYSNMKEFEVNYYRGV